MRSSRQPSSLNYSTAAERVGSATAWLPIGPESWGFTGWRWFSGTAPRYIRDTGGSLGCGRRW
ncbi:hypothetical protein C0090_06715 [Mycobacterium tuberculosis]|nr:hypothetical protein C0090_06715 [Mycobacterium tuberculosis]